MKPGDDPVQGLLGEIERLGQVGTLDPGRLPDQPQEVPFVAGGDPRRLYVSQKMCVDMV
ncbi:hypothetical protein RLEG12_03870 (plasmid) [Rhizobium leguminosarum bv. trifolii CB782]|nr:hypothetical protein RLEG12_03870 [Rhizobium leguminosarum bv. trifolii CB782]